MLIVVGVVGDAEMSAKPKRKREGTPEPKAAAMPPAAQQPKDAQKPAADPKVDAATAQARETAIERAAEVAKGKRKDAARRALLEVCRAHRLRLVAFPMLTPDGRLSAGFDLVDAGDGGA